MPSSLTQRAHADLIVETFQDIAWDRTDKPTGPLPINFRLTADSDLSPNNQLNSFSIGLRVVPSNGATGSFEIKSVSVPSTDPVFANFAISPVLQKLGGGLQTVSGDNAAFTNVTIPTSGRTLFQAQFYSPGNNALGTFNVYADVDTSNYFTTTEFDGLKFANVSGPANLPGVLLGSFEITVSAVPEPGCIALVSVSLVTLLAARRRSQSTKLAT